MSTGCAGHGIGSFGAHPPGACARTGGRGTPGPAKRWVALPKKNELADPRISHHAQGDRSRDFARGAWSCVSFAGSAFANARRTRVHANALRRDVRRPTRAAPVELEAGARRAGRIRSRRGRDGGRDASSAPQHMAVIAHREPVEVKRLEDTRPPDADSRGKNGTASA